MFQTPCYTLVTSYFKILLGNFQDKERKTLMFIVQEEKNSDLSKISPQFFQIIFFLFFAYSRYGTFIPKCSPPKKIFGSITKKSI